MEIGNTPVGQIMGGHGTRSAAEIFARVATPKTPEIPSPIEAKFLRKNCMTID